MTTTPQGLTSPRHAKHPLRTWLDALTATPLVAVTIDALLIVIIVIAALGTITACNAPEPAIPTITPATSTAPAPQPTTTWEQVGA